MAEQKATGEVEEVTLTCLCGKTVSLILLLGLYGSATCSCGREWLVEILPVLTDRLKVATNEASTGNQS